MRSQDWIKERHAAVEKVLNEPGEACFDRQSSDVALVALALQALEWSVRPPSGQVVAYRPV